MGRTVGQIKGQMMGQIKGKTADLTEVELEIRGCGAEEDGAGFEDGSTGPKAGCAGPGGIKGNVIICPGGAYRWHSPRESLPVAKAFAARGWKPWILYYTVSAHGEALGTTPLCQAAEAVRAVRAAWPGKPVVLCGFSAGGHVAASLGVHWKDESLFAKDEQAALRPDGLILGYPVITAGKYAHWESMEMLVGTGAAAGAPGTIAAGAPGAAESVGAAAGYFSLEDYVDAQTPPAFIWHTAGDHTVMVQNSLCFASRLADAGVPFELHIYPRGEHGLSLATKEVEEPEKKRYANAHVAGWFEQCAQWLDQGVMHG